MDKLAAMVRANCVARIGTSDVGTANQVVDTTQGQVGSGSGCVGKHHRTADIARGEVVDRYRRGGCICQRSIADRVSDIHRA